MGFKATTKDLEDFLEFCDSAAKTFEEKPETKIRLNEDQIMSFYAALSKLTGTWLDSSDDEKEEAVEKGIALGRRKFLSYNFEKRAALICARQVQKWRSRKRGKVFLQEDLLNWQPLINKIRAILLRALKQREKARKSINPKNRSRASRKNLVKAREVFASLPDEEIKEIRKKAGEIGGEKRDKALDATRRKEIAKKGAAVRWSSKAAEKDGQESEKTDDR